MIVAIIVNINVHEFNYNCRQYSLNRIDILKGIVHFISIIWNVFDHVNMIAKNIYRLVWDNDSQMLRIPLTYVSNRTFHLSTSHICQITLEKMYQMRFSINDISIL